MDITPIAYKALLESLNAVFPVLISLKAAIPSGIFCIPIRRAIAKAEPDAIEAPIAKDSGIVSKPIPISISAPPPLRVALHQQS